MKICYLCKNGLSLNEFYKNNKSKDGYQHRCKKCAKETVSNWQKQNPKKVHTRNMRWEKRHPDKVKRKRSKYRNSDTYKNWYYQKYYNITLKTYLLLSEQQDNKCLICSKKESLHVDHCHKTGKIRGLLCGNCNKAIGLLKENKNNLNNAILYLEKFN